MSQIKIRNLTFAHDGAADNLFQNVCLTLDTDWRLGFIGRNGRGKTTFLHLLMNRYEYAGTIAASVDFDYFPFPVPDPDRETGPLLAGLVPGLADWRLPKELSLLAVDPVVLSRPFRTLSGGERTKVLLAALFLKDHNFLLIDEPTNHLDAAGRAVLGAYLSGKSGFILVSHDRFFVDQCVDHVLSINRADIELQKGNFSTWQQNRDYQDHWAQARENRLKTEIRQLGEAARRAADWSAQAERGKKGGGPCDRGYIGHQAARLMKRSKTVENRRLKAAEEKKDLWRARETVDRLSLATLRHPQRRLLALENLTVAYGGRPVIDGLSATLDQGERVVLSGPNGCGKSSLMKLILGEPVPHSGRLHRAPGLVCSYVPQEPAFPEGLKIGLRDYARRNTLDESLFKAILHKLGLEKKQFETALGDFSDGQKKKILLAASLSRPAHLYIWDEPLNFIDVISRMQIETLLVEHRPTLLVVEHDRRFAEKVGTRRLDL